MKNWMNNLLSAVLLTGALLSTSDVAAIGLDDEYKPTKGQWLALSLKKSPCEFEENFGKPDALGIEVVKTDPTTLSVHVVSGSKVDPTIRKLKAEHCESVLKSIQSNKQFGWLKYKIIYEDIK